MAHGRYRWVVLAVGVGAQAAFMGAVSQGIPALGPAHASLWLRPEAAPQREQAD